MRLNLPRALLLLSSPPPLMVAMVAVVASPSCSSPSLSFYHSNSASRRSTFTCGQRPPRSRKQSLRSGASSRGNGDESEGVSHKGYPVRGKDERAYLLPDGGGREVVFKWTGIQKKDKGLVYDLKEHQMVQNWRWKEKRTDDEGVAALIQTLSQDKMPEVAMKLLIDLKSKGFVPGCATLSALVLCYANNGLFQQAKAMWSEIIHSSFLPGIEFVSGLMDAYAMMGQFDEISTIVHEIASRQDFGFSYEVYSLAVSCFGKVGQLELMEDMVKEMVLRGFKVDSMTGNAFVKYYSLFGSIEEMEAAYGRMKKSRILIEKEAIRAMASAYISERKFYKLGEFLRDVGLGRRNVGNLLWNLLLLSYAANFKMKSLQREFISMVSAGFSPDLTTFNIRSLAYSRMCMFWDLHLSIEHMKHEGVIPDLVTYGCLVDAYLERRLGRNLSFALDKMNAKSAPVMLTDPLVFEALGKGDFQSSSESLLESTRQRGWTYSKLVSKYLRKQYRSNQIFWNY